MDELVVITGLSGAGRSQVGNNLEDLGFFVIDNLPPQLISKVIELASSGISAESRVAIAVGSGMDYTELETALAETREAGTAVRVLFLNSRTNVLVRRYESSKRRHPLGSREGDGEGLLEMIEQDRALLEPVRESADLVIDTSDLTIYELKARITELFGDPMGDAMTTTIESFGYKHGLPGDVDLVIDCRFLKNPYWNEELRPFTGNDENVREYVLSLPQAEEFLDRLTHLLDLLVPAYRAEGKAYLTIALGCTGGHHRSVVMANELVKRLGASGTKAALNHRDIEK